MSFVKGVCGRQFVCLHAVYALWISLLLMGQPWQAFNNVPLTCLELIIFSNHLKREEYIHSTTYVMAAIQHTASFETGEVRDEVPTAADHVADSEATGPRRRHAKVVDSFPTFSKT